MRDPVTWGGFGGICTYGAVDEWDAGLWWLALALLVVGLTCAAYGNRLVRRLRGRDA